MKTRINFLDNLRTFMILLVVVLHSAIGYTPFLDSMWIVSNPDKCDSLGLVVLYLDIFVMFIMFFISGYFIPSSLKGKSMWALIVSKFKRIMLPWIIAVLTLIPAYKYIFLYSRGLPQEEWFTYFHFFNRVGGNAGYFADHPAQSWLWFLPVLFMFQVVYMLLAKTGIFRIRISLPIAVISTFVLGLTYSMLIASSNLNGWFDSPILHFQRERLLIYFLFFLLGSLCFKLNAFSSTKIKRSYFILANIGLTISLGVFTAVTLNFYQNMIEPGRNIYLISELMDGILYYGSILMSVFGFLYVFIGIFKSKLNFTNATLSRLSNNSYGVYIIHMIVIGIFSFMLLKLSIPAGVKFIIVFFLSYIFSNALVCGYRALFQKALRRNAVSIFTLIAAIVFSIFAYMQQVNSAAEHEPSADYLGAPEMSIHMAAIQGDIKVVQHHILAGTDVNMQEPANGSTPLISAALFGKTVVVRLLIEAGADVNFQNNDGSCALHTAAFFCYPDIVALLLESGANPEIKNNAGSTPLQSVQAPFEAVRGIYDYFGNTLGPLGLELNYDSLQIVRPIIVGILQQNAVQ